MDGNVILGIDPALGTTGYGVLSVVDRSVKLLDAGTICSKSSQPLESRLKELYEGITEVIQQFKPAHFAIEQLYSHYDHPTTAILMGHARGTICLSAAQAGLSVTSYAATMVKKMLTGNGRSPKSQMQLAVQHELRLSKPLEPADVADALAIALCHFHYLKMPMQMKSRSAG